MAESTPHNPRLYELLGEYHQAVEAGRAPDRDAFLAAHPDLADEIGEYLDEQDRLHRLAEPFRPALFLGPEPTQAGGDPAPRPGESIRYLGDYELRAEIARGGMGVVFDARQISLNRPVALKMILAGDLAGPDERQRFRLEAEAAAGLDHPNIIPIYEVGTHDGHGYFSMKRVDGGTLAGRLAEFTADPRRAARLLAQVARAVHHAHERGILHRDLKPSNVLIDPDGRPIVSDFGLAKRFAVDAAAGLTASNAIVGSPPYMAPEQVSPARGGVTTATDVYGLGAILYAMLAGRAPFRGASPLETLEQVRVREPDPPGRIRRGVDRELETISLKCLAKEPSARYGSALAVAEELERWLRGESIAARPVAGPVRLWRWCRRNRLVAGLLGSIGLLLSALAITLAIAAALLRAQRDEARANFDAARAAVDEYLTRVGENRLLREPGLQPLRRDLLGSALRYYEEFLARNRDDPRRRAECAEAWLRVGRITQQLASPTAAQAPYERALTLYRDLARDGRTDPPVVEGLASALVAVGIARADAGDTATTRALYEEAVRLLSGRREPTGRMRAVLARAHHEIGALLVHFGEHEAARESYRRAIAEWESAHAAAPGDLDVGMGLARSRVHLAWTLSDTDADAEAWSEYQRVQRLLADLTERAPRDPEIANALANSHTDLGNAHARAGRLPEAEREYRQALALARTLAEANPEVERYRGNVAIDLGNLAELLRDRGRPDDARAGFAEGIAVAEAIVAASPRVSTYRAKLLVLLFGLGDLEREAGRVADASDWFGRAREVAAQLAVDDPSARHDNLLAEALVGAARCAILEGTFEAAGADLDEAFRRLDRPDAARDVVVDRLKAEAYLARAQLDRLRGDLDAAREAGEAALALWQGLAAAPARPVAAEIGAARTLLELGHRALLAGDRDDALRLYREAGGLLDACADRSPAHAGPVAWRERVRQAIEQARQIGPDPGQIGIPGAPRG